MIGNLVTSADQRRGAGETDPNQGAPVPLPSRGDQSTCCGGGKDDRQCITVAELVDLADSGDVILFGHLKTVSRLITDSRGICLFRHSRYGTKLEVPHAQPLQSRRHCYPVSDGVSFPHEANDWSVRCRTGKWQGSKWKPGNKILMEAVCPNVRCTDIIVV